MGWLMGSSWCGVSIIGRMVIDMNKTQVRTLEQVGQVLWCTEVLHAVVAGALSLATPAFAGQIEPVLVARAGAATSFTRSA